MTQTIFFSWQADTPTTAGRNLIERALERASSAIGQDTEIEEAIRELEVDKDTKGVSGSPPIVDTIFNKIDAAAVFVPDLTFVGSRLDGRPTPNPNVLIEYGWALKSLKHSRIVPIMNEAHGKPTSESMPFDMKHLRFPITYDCPVGASSEDRRAQQATLAKKLEGAIRAVLNSPDFKAALPPPPSPPSFMPREALDGPGKFRKAGDPLGQVDGLSFTGTVDRLLYQTDHPAFWLRVMPDTDTGKTWTGVELRKAIHAGGTIRLLPMFEGSGSFGEYRANDSIGTYGFIEEGKTFWSAALFKTGEIWSINTFLLDATRKNKSRSSILLDEGMLARKLVDYGATLELLGIAPPFRWIAGMEDLKGRALYVPQPGNRSAQFPSGSSVEDVVVAGGTYSPGDDPRAALRPFFTAIYDACGLERPSWLDAP